MNKKSLLVLAASIYQVPVIETAKRLGYRVITVDNVPTNPGHALAELSYNVDTTERDDVLAIAQKEKISGIIAACTDIALPTAAYVAEKMSLSGPPAVSAEIVCNKVSFRRWLNEQGFTVPRSFAVNKSFISSKELFKNHWWILKPDRSSGSKGIFIIRYAEEYGDRIQETLSFSPTSAGILEQFIDGLQITCEGIITGGKVRAAWILDRQTAAPPYVTTIGQHIPSRLPLGTQKKIISVLEDIWKRLGITDAPFDCDAIIAGDSIYVIELSPRLGGNSISTLLKYATDFDIVEYAVRLACGEVIDDYRFSDVVETMAVVLLGVQKKGQLSYDEVNLEALKREPWVQFICIDKALGSPVQPFINGRHRIGEALIKGIDRDDLDAKVVELRARLHLGGE
jgi:biotin carboxylase